MSGRLILRLAPILALIAYVSFMVGGLILSVVHAQLAVGQGLGVAAPGAGGSGCGTGQYNTGSTCTATATQGPTASPTPTMSVPTAEATTGNVFTTLTGASATTHDMEVCYIIETAAINTWFIAAADGSNDTAWSLLEPKVPIITSGVWSGFIAHCVQPSEPATYSFYPLTNNSGTVQACLLLRNTHCGLDVPAADATPTGGATSATVNYPAVTTSIANDMILYGAGWGPGTMTSNPSGVTIAVNALVITIGYLAQASPATVAAKTGTLSSSAGNNIGGVVAVSP